MPRRRPATKRDINDLTNLRAGLYCRVSLDKDGTEKSVDDQEADGRAWAERAGVTLAEHHVYRDADRSASRFARKEREDFNRLLGDIEAGRLDLVWFWELSRSQRRLDVFAKLRDLCRDHGVLWVIRDRVYDPNNYADMMTLGMLSVVGENESEMTSLRVERGKRMSAHAGKPAGFAPYGYKRVRNVETGAWERDVPDVFDGDGHPVTDSPAYVVREIFERFAAGQSIRSIRTALETRGVPAPRGGTWRTYVLRYIAMNPSYIARRVHAAKSHRPADRHKAILEGVVAQWPPLVSEELFWTVQGILTDPTRKTWRPGRARHLLSGITRCGKCGDPLSTRNKRGPYYVCPDRACVGIRASALDAYVEEVIVGWLSDPDVFADLTRVDDSAAAMQARAEAEEARAELAQLYADVKAGAVSATIATLNEQRLQAVIAAAEQRAQAAKLPAVLAGNIGPEARARWSALDVEVKRQIIQEVADIRVRPVGRAQRVHPSERVVWRPLLGPDAERE